MARTVSVCVSLGCDHPPTVAGFQHAASHAGRNMGPALLFNWFYSGRLVRADLAAVVCDVWAMAEFPQRYLTIDIWCEFFRMAEYPKPSAPLTLYRGATSGRARRMSWTTDAAQAEWFAERRRKVGKVASVYTVVAPPPAVLAVVDDLLPRGRHECEVVVDPRQLPKVHRLGA